MGWAKVGEGREAASEQTLCKRNGPRWPIFGLDCAEREQFDPRLSENRLSRRPSVRRTQAVTQKGVTVHTQSYASLPADSQRTVNTPYRTAKVTLSPRRLAKYVTLPVSRTTNVEVENVVTIGFGIDDTTFGEHPVDELSCLLLADSHPLPVIDPD